MKIGRNFLIKMGLFLFTATLLFPGNHPLLKAAISAEKSTSVTNTPNIDIEKDVYVILYRQRLELAKVALRRQKALAAYSRASHQRAESLFRSRAVPLEELQEKEALMLSDVERVNEYLVKIAEAEALLDICRVRRESGLDMPIYPTQVF